MLLCVISPPTVTSTKGLNHSCVKYEQASEQCSIQYTFNNNTGALSYRQHTYKKRWLIKYFSIFFWVQLLNQNLGRLCPRRRRRASIRRVCFSLALAAAIYCTQFIIVGGHSFYWQGINSNVISDQILSITFQQGYNNKPMLAHLT